MTSSSTARITGLFKPPVAPDHATRPGRPSIDQLDVVHQYATNRTVPTVPDPEFPVPCYGDGGGGANLCTGGQVVVTAITRFLDGKPAGTYLVRGVGSAIDIAVHKGKLAVAIPGSGQGMPNGSYTVPATERPRM